MIQEECSNFFYLLNKSLPNPPEGEVSDGLQQYDRCPAAIHIARIDYGLDEQAYRAALQGAINADFAGFWYNNANRPQIEHTFVEGWWGIFNEDRTPKVAIVETTGG